MGTGSGLAAIFLRRWALHIQYNRASHYLLMYVLHTKLISISYHFCVLFYPAQHTVLHTCGHWRPVQRPSQCSCIREADCIGRAAHQPMYTCNIIGLATIY